MIVRKIDRSYRRFRQFIIRRIALPLIVLLLLLRLYNSHIKPVNTQNQYHTVLGLDILKTGMQIELSGDMESADQFPVYTHTLTTKEGISFGLKSTHLNLSYFSGQVIIFGNLENITSTPPVINVTTIKDKPQSLILQEKTYKFVDMLLTLDFSQQPGFHAHKIDENIRITFNSNPLVTIIPLQCDAQDIDCEQLRLDYQYNNVDNFISLGGHVFYKKDAQSRIMFNDAEVGYIFTGIDDETLVDISHTIIPITLSTIISEHMPVQTDICSNDNAYLERLQTIRIMNKKNHIYTLIIEGISNTNQNSVCDVTFDARNDWTIIDNYYTVLE